MNHYNSISWPLIPTAEILDIIPIFDPELAKVQTLDITTKETIIKLLNIELTQGSDYKIMVVYMPPGKKLWIHSDKPVETKEPGKSQKAIFLPLTSCEKLHWSWFECTDTSQIFYHVEKGMWQQVIPMMPYSAANEIETVPANKTMITDIGTWHALRNESDTPEIALSIRVLPWSWEEFSSISIPFPITFK
jgi:mannose-6-phosphate isomerase-like protein (cupin superfamily)